MLNGQELNVRDCQMFNWPGKASPPPAKRECSLGHILIQLHIKEGDFRKGSGLYSKVSGWSAGHAFVQGGVATGH